MPLDAWEAVIKEGASVGLGAQLQRAVSQSPPKSCPPRAPATALSLCPVAEVHVGLRRGPRCL